MNEVFSEGFSRRGGVISHALYRLEFVSAEIGVRSDLIATLHARVIAIEDGQVAVVGRGRFGNVFAFRCPVQWLQDATAHGVKQFTDALLTAAGPHSSIATGQRAALVRAVLELSDSEHPMPRPVEVAG